MSSSHSPASILTPKTAFDQTDQVTGDGVLSRRDLAARAAATLSVVSMAAAAAASTPVADQERGTAKTACPRDHGATGDGQYRPLADRFASVEDARKQYPFVTSLRQSLDWAGIQAALDAVEASSGRVVIPVGRFIISDTLRLPNQITLEGESRWGSVIDNQNLPLHAPQLTNKEPSAFLYVTIRNITLNGGTHALRVHAEREVAGCVIEGVTAQLQTVANFEFNSIQTTVFRDCHLIHGKFGISITDFPCNSIHLFNTRLGSHSEASLRVRGADLLVMVGGSIEGGGAVGPATIDIGPGGAYAKAIAFRHVYFENTHRVLLKTRGVQPVSFDGCKFTGTGAGRDAFGPYEFDCGDDLVEFGSNHWDQPTSGPRHMMVVGRNDGLTPTGLMWQAKSGGIVALTSTTVSATAASRLVVVRRIAQAEGAWRRLQVTFSVIGRERGGRIAIRHVTTDMIADLSPAAAEWLMVSPPTGTAATEAGILCVLAREGEAKTIGIRVAASAAFRPEWVQMRLEEVGGPSSPSGLAFSAS